MSNGSVRYRRRNLRRLVADLLGRRGVRGAAAIEFAIIAPILVWVLLGIMQFGAIFYVWHNMTAVARETARRVVVGEWTTATTAEGEAHTLLSGIIPWVPGFIIDATLPNPGNPAETDVTVVITAPLVEAAMFDALGILGSNTLRAEATMRME